MFLVIIERYRAVLYSVLISSLVQTHISSILSDNISNANVSKQSSNWHESFYLSVLSYWNVFYLSQFLVQIYIVFAVNFCFNKNLCHICFQMSQCIKNKAV